MYLYLFEYKIWDPIKVFNFLYITAGQKMSVYRLFCLLRLVNSNYNFVGNEFHRHFQWLLNISQQGLCVRYPNLKFPPLKSGFMEGFMLLSFWSANIVLKRQNWQYLSKKLQIVERSIISREVVRGVAGVAMATPKFQDLFSKIIL